MNYNYILYELFDTGSGKGKTYKKMGVNFF